MVYTIAIQFHNLFRALTTLAKAFRSVYVLSACLPGSQAEASRLGKQLHCGTRLLVI